MKNTFEIDYIGKPVIVIGGGLNDKPIYAFIYGVELIGKDKNIVCVTYKNATTEEIFASGGIVLPDTQKMRDLIKFLSHHLNNKETWEMLAEIMTFHKNMDYFAEYCYLNNKK